MQGRMKPDQITNPLKYSQWLIDEMDKIDAHIKSGKPGMPGVPDFRQLAGGNAEKEILLHAAWLRFEPPFDKDATHVHKPHRPVRRRFQLQISMLPEIAAWLDEKAESEQSSRSRVLEQLVRVYMDAEMRARGRTPDHMEEEDDGRPAGAKGRAGGGGMGLRPPKIVESYQPRLETPEQHAADLKADRARTKKEKEREQRKARERAERFEEIKEIAAEDGVDPYERADEVEAKVHREEQERKRRRGGR